MEWHPFRRRRWYATEIVPLDARGTDTRTTGAYFASFAKTVVVAGAIDLCRERTVRVDLVSLVAAALRKLGLAGGRQRARLQPDDEVGKS